MPGEHKPGDGWVDRLVWPKVHRTEGCWFWTGRTNPAGYALSGSARNYTGTQYVHRAIWIDLYGPIADGYEVDHVCFVRNCCRPGHLRLLTVAENRREGRLASITPTTVCRNGHPRTPESTFIPGNGVRQCLICLRIARKRAWTKANAKRRAAREAARG